MVDTEVFRFSNSGASLGMLSYMSGVHEEGLDGSDKLTVRCAADLAKRERLVWRDATGTWHEHMVDSTTRVHSGGAAVTEAVCSNSISELFGVLAQGGKIKGTAKKLLSMLLSGTRWTAGSCSDFKDAGTFELEVWHKTIRECVTELCDLVGGELVTVIEVGDYGVSKRTVRIVEQRGSAAVMRQFSYGRNVASVRREVSADEVYTAVVGYGAKADGSDGSDYAERITATVTKDKLLDKWGIVGEGGRKLHNWLLYTDDACTDAAFLKKQCKRQLDAFSRPPVSYEFDVVEVDGDLWSDVKLGNMVSCVDEDFGDEVEVVERVSRIKRSLRGRASCVVTIGQRANPMVEKFKAQERDARRKTGSTTRSESIAPVTTNGEYSGGDRWTHQVNGVAKATGTINFVTSSGSSGSSTPATPTQPSGDAWGGGGNGNFSSSGGGKF